MAREWRNAQWGDLATLEYGRALRGYGSVTGDYRVFGTNGPIGWHHEPLCTHPSVIIGRKGAYRGVYYSPAPFFVINTAFYLEPLVEIDTRWAYYELLTHDINSMDSGSAIPSTSRDAFYRLPVRVPPLAEQHAIAHILGTLDDKIELNRRMSGALEDIARALFRSWFIDVDPVRAKTEGRDPGLPPHLARLFPSRFVGTGDGEAPEGWTRAGIGAWVDTLSGGTPSKSNPALWRGNIPWISPKVMTAIHADEVDEYVTEKAVGNGTRIAPSGSALVMVRGMGLHEQVRVSQARRNVTFNQDVKALVPRDIVPSLLLFALLDAQAELLTRVESSGHGTGRLPTDILLGHPVTMPPRHDQARLGEVFDAINDRLACAREQSRTLAALRDTLLPKLISGVVRVKDVERIMARSPHDSATPLGKWTLRASASCRGPSGRRRRLRPPYRPYQL